MEQKIKLMAKQNKNDIRQLVTFDIDTKVTSLILDNISVIYDQIGKFMHKNGFEHVQGSVYISCSQMKDNTVTHLMKALYGEYPYMKKCVRDMIIADISPRHSLKHLAEYDGQPGKYAKENTYNTKNGPIPKDEFKEYALKNASPGLEKINNKRRKKQRDNRIK